MRQKHDKISFILYILFTLLFSSSCRNLIGHYHWEGNWIGPNSANLKIKSNNTFTFRAWSDILGEDIIEGVWQKKRDTLIVLTKLPPEKDKFINFTEKFDDKIVGNKITIQDSFGDSTIAFFYINDIKEGYLSLFENVVDVDSIYKIKVESLSIVDSVSVNPNNNDFTFSIEHPVIENFITLSKKWKIKSGRLISLDDKSNERSDVYLKKSLLNLFHRF